jgi:universal stress protein A
MLNYKSILYATNMDDSCKPALKRVKEFAEKFDAKVHIVHVVRNMTSTYGFAAVDSQVELSLVDTARERLDSLLESVGIPSENATISIGQVTGAILDEAESLKADVIMLNGHTHNIFARMLSTEDNIVNQAKCDVIVLRD